MGEDGHLHSAEQCRQSSALVAPPEVAVPGDSGGRADDDRGQMAARPGCWPASNPATLEVVGEEKEQPVKGDDGQADGQTGTAAVAIAGDAQRQERVARRGLDRNEAEKEDGGQRQRGDGDGRRPPGAASESP